MKHLHPLEFPSDMGAPESKKKRVVKHLFIEADEDHIHLQYHTRKGDLYREVIVNDRRCIIVHAGYKEGIKGEEERQKFFLEERDFAYTEGGIQDGMVIAGHTPTLVEGQFVFIDGKVFRYYDERKNCIFYDIDCGCVFRERDSRGKLACIRLEDEKIFYV